MPKVSETHLQARRQQILDAAAACFTVNGFHRTSMQDIVRECGISAGLVYRYFASKDEMIAAIVNDWHAHRAEAIAGPLATDGTDSAETLADRYLDLLRELGKPEGPDGRLALQIWAESVRSTAIRDLARSGVDTPRRAIAALLADRLPEDLDPDALVRVMIAVYQGLLVQTVWDDTVDHAAFVDTVAALIRRLL